MNIKMLKAALAGLALSVSSLANAGLIQMEAEYSSTSATQSFSWTMLLEEADLNTVNTRFQLLSSPQYAFIVALDMLYIDSTGSSFSLNLSELKTAGVRMLYNHSPFLADGTNQRHKISDINFSGTNELATAFESKGALNGIYGIGRNTLGDSARNVSFALTSFKSTTSVPEPSTIAIFALGIMGLASRRFKNQ